MQETFKKKIQAFLKNYDFFETTNLIETENFLLKVLQIKLKNN